MATLSGSGAAFRKQAGAQGSTGFLSRCFVTCGIVEAAKKPKLLEGEPAEAEEIVLVSPVVTLVETRK